MAAVDGIWYCANFLGDSFELTLFDDGALMLQMLRKRFRSRGESVRLEPRGEGRWEAFQKIRICQVGEKLLMQRFKHGQWGTEVQALQNSLAATGKYFRNCFPKGKDCEDGKEGCMLRRESSTVFKLEPFNAEVAFRETHIGDASLDDTEKVVSCESEWEGEVEECKICMARKADVVLMPCGHAGLCETCLHAICQRSTSPNCPFCRHAIDNIAALGKCASFMILTGENTTPIANFPRKARLAWP